MVYDKAHFHACTRFHAVICSVQQSMLVTSGYGAKRAGQGRLTNIWTSTCDGIYKNQYKISRHIGPVTKSLTHQVLVLPVASQVPLRSPQAVVPHATDIQWHAASEHFKVGFPCFLEA